MTPTLRFYSFIYCFGSILIIHRNKEPFSFSWSYIYHLQGRGGKGSIYVWAAGNGGDRDSCAADGYVQSIYTIAIGALQSDGERATYDERCSAKIASTFVTHTDVFSTVSYNHIF